MLKAIPKKISHEDENLIKQLIAKYLPYWPLFVLAVLAALTAGYFYLRYTVPLYEAKASVIVKDEKKGTDESKLTESLVTINSKQLLENEIEVLKSRKLMDSVVLEQHLYASIMRKGKVNHTSAYLTSPVQIEAQSPDSFREAKKISLSYDRSRGTVLVDKQFHYKLNEFVHTKWGILRFLPNENYAPSVNAQEEEEGDEFYFNLMAPKKTTSLLLSRLEVTAATKLSTIIELRFRDPISEKAENVLNSLMKAYQLAGLKAKNDLARNTLAFVENRLGDVSHQMDSIQRRVQGYKTGSGAVDIGAQGQLFLQNVSENDQKLSEVNTQLSVLNQVENSISSSGSAGAIVPSTLGVNDPMLSQMLDRLYQTELEYEKLKKTNGEGSPKMIALRDQIAKIRPDIMANVKNQKKGLLATRSNISTTTGRYNSMLRSMPQKEKQLLELTRDESTLNGIYQFLLQKKEESILSFSSNISDSRIVDTAQAGSSPVSPNPKLVYGLLLLLFLGIVMLFIAIREFFTGKILYRKEVEDLTTVPVIAEVAFDNTGKKVIVEPGKRTYGTEEFRKIRSSLSYLGIKDDRKKVLVTSSISGEGKSFIAANLAISIASTGKKTVLVDLDLNNPTIGKILAVKKDAGVTDYLMGKKTVKEIIGKIGEYENLYYISAGTMVDGPSELLANGKVKELISYLDETFDSVIIDISPVVLVTDAYMISDLCDATLYVVRHKYTPKMIIKRMDENNVINPLYNTGIIFNGVKGRGFFKNSYGYGYGYSYVYGYNAEDKKKRK